MFVLWTVTLHLMVSFQDFQGVWHWGIVFSGVGIFFCHRRIGQVYGLFIPRCASLLKYAYSLIRPIELGLHKMYTIIHITLHTLGN
jgi:hypothetical protein